MSPGDEPEGVNAKTVLITGCSSGIGRATAEGFLEEDWTVYATARNPADIEALGDKGCEIATLDLASDESVERVVDRILDEEGTLDCLVTAGGDGRFGPVEDVPVESVHEQFAGNVYGPYRLIRTVLPHMRREGDGTIVTLSSAAGRVAFPGGSAYCGSKFALEAIADALRNEVGEFGIDVVVVEPGPVNSEADPRIRAAVEEEDRSEAYEELYELYEDTALVTADGPVTTSPERVGAEIVNVASMTRPPARVPVGAAGTVGSLARFLPDSIRDALYETIRSIAR